MRRRATGSDSTSYSTKSHPRHCNQSRISSVWGQPEAPKSSRVATVEHLQQFANDVIDRSLYLLDSRNVITVHSNRTVCQASTLDFATVITKKCHRQQSALTSFFQRHDDVPRAATSGYSNSNILRSRLRNKLAKKDS